MFSPERNGLYTRKEYCPIDGKYSVRYKNNNPAKPVDCTGYDSTMDSCPSGSILNFRLRGCNAISNTADLMFECLASWTGSNNENYLIFSDKRVSNSMKPKYRCAVSNLTGWSELEFPVEGDGRYLVSSR